MRRYPKQSTFARLKSKYFLPKTIFELATSKRFSTTKLFLKSSGVFFFTTTDKYHEQLRATHIVFKSDGKTRCAR